MWLGVEEERVAARIWAMGRQAGAGPAKLVLVLVPVPVSVSVPELGLMVGAE